MSWRYDDGGRSAAGYRGSAGDCVVRALAIATGEDYAEVYREIARRNAAVGGSRSARNGTPRKVYDAFLRERGWSWHACMSIGSGTTVHLRSDELPGGRIIARCSRHIVAVIDGVAHDTHDPTRDGTRAVYGYWHRV